MKLFKIFIILSIVCFTSLLYAKGPSRSGGGYKSTPKPSVKPSTSYKNNSNSYKSSSTATKSSSTTTKPNLTKTDQVAYKKAASQGKAFTTKSAAVADFKSKAKTNPKIQSDLNKKYPTSFNKEPEKRPDYIPNTYQGNQVTYNNGGYGYYSGSTWNPLLTYMLIDTMSDSMLMANMSSHGYYIGPTGPTGSRWNIALILLLCVMGCAVIFVVIYKD